MTIDERNRIERLAVGRTQLAEALSSTAILLYSVWRCNTDAERAEFGQQIAAVVDRYGKPSSQIIADLEGVAQ